MLSVPGLQSGGRPKGLGTPRISSWVDPWTIAHPERETTARVAVGIRLRRHRSLASRALHPNGVPIEPGVKIVIICGCGHRNEVNLGALAAAGEPARAANDRG